MTTTNTSTTAETRRVIEAAYGASTQGDIPGFLAFIGEDIVCHEPAYLPFGGTYTGKAAFLELAKVITDYLDFGQATVHHIVAEGERAIGIISIADRATNAPTYFAEEATVRDGKIVELRLFYFDAQSMLRMPPAAG